MGTAYCSISMPSGSSGYWLTANIEWDDIYNVTVDIEAVGGWRLKPSWASGDTNNKLTGVGNFYGEFQGELNETYVFQMWDQVDEIWYQSSFTITEDSGGDSGGGSGGDDGGDDDEQGTYKIILNRGGYIWDVFPFDTIYYGYQGEIINLSTPRRNDDRTPAGNFNIVGNLNGGGTSITIEASITKHTTYAFDGWKDLNNNLVYFTKYDIYGNATLSAKQSSSSTLEYSNNKIENLGHPIRNEESKTYTITYNYDGGTLSKESETSNARLSYEFNYWCSNSSGTGIKYDDSYEFKKNDGEEVNVYAIWTATVEEPAIINLPTTEKVGFKFKGWTTADQAILYEAGTSVEVTKDTEFIAVWESEGQVFIHDGEKWIPII